MILAGFTIRLGRDAAPRCPAEGVSWRLNGVELVWRIGNQWYCLYGSKMGAPLDTAERPPYLGLRVKSVF